MHSRRIHAGLAALALSLLFIGCNRAPTGTPPPPPPASELREEVTRNVTYRGMLEEAPVGIYMQGTHQLVLDAGRFLLLESSTVPLDAYVGEEVEVTGDVRSTIEEGGLIMSVNRIVSLTVLSSSSEASYEESSSSSESSSISSESPEVSSAALASSKKSIAAVPLSSVSPVTASSAAAVSSLGSGESSNPGVALMLRTKEMASVKMDPANWTQKYCTGHIGFCIPVHKNWWFKSFGATTSSFWHVEISSKEIVSLGEGPIVLTLVEGAASENDRRVVTAGSDVIGYYSWTGNRHFDIRAPSELRTAVEYIIQNLVPHQEE